MNKEKIKERIEYLKIELTHHGYHDGWVLKGMKEELEWLEGELQKNLDFDGK